MSALAQVGLGSLLLVGSSLAAPVPLALPRSGEEGKAWDRQLGKVLGLSCLARSSAAVRLIASDLELGDSAESIGLSLIHI